MSQRLKRWESPRKQGRNDKGRGGSARKRQLDKRERMLRQKLKAGDSINNTQKRQQLKKAKKGEDDHPLLFYLPIDRYLAINNLRTGKIQYQSIVLARDETPRFSNEQHISQTLKSLINDRRSITLAVSLPLLTY